MNTLQVYKSQTTVISCKKPSGVGVKVEIRDGKIIWTHILRDSNVGSSLPADWELVNLPDNYLALVDLRDCLIEVLEELDTHVNQDTLDR